MTATMPVNLEAEMELLRIDRTEMMETFKENENVIHQQRERIYELEFYLGKLRDMMYDGFYKTVGVLPMVPVPDKTFEKPKRKKS